jgi:hypothetical protein
MQKTTREKYDIARHHAWGGLAALSLVSTIRLILPTGTPALNHLLSALIIPLLIIYTACALILTYRYRTGLSSASKGNIQAGGTTRGPNDATGKYEKKREKAYLKAHKKSLKKKR